MDSTTAPPVCEIMVPIVPKPDKNITNTTRINPPVATTAVFFFAKAVTAFFARTAIDALCPAAVLVAATASAPFFVAL